MAQFKVNVSDPKTGKTYKKELDESASKALVGQKLGATIKGELVELPAGYEVKITGGSSKAGFPMRKDIDGQLKKGILIGKSVGNRNREKGMRLRKTVVGNTISENIVQINTHIVTYGKEPIEKPAEEAPAQEEKKEEAPKEGTKEE